jgi:hypothetical protein
MAEPASHAVAPAAAKKRRRYVVAALGLLVMVTSGLIWWVFGNGTFTDQVEERVKAGIPAGTDRAAAEAWISRSFRVIPSFSAPGVHKRSRSPTLLQRAGMENVPGGGVVMFPAVRQGFIGEIISHIRPDLVWVFLLLDESGRVQDYRFYSVAELREAERAEQQEHPR